MSKMMNTSSTMKSYIPPTIRTFKIALVGDGGVGKTTYLKRFLTGDFEKRYIPTVGAEIYDMELHPLTEEAGKLSRFEIWDTAGQEKYTGVTTNYYKNADAAIIMFDTTSLVSYKNVAKWYNDIREVSPNIPIVLVGNKCDVKDRKVKAHRITFHRMHNLAYFDISAKSNYNFDKPFLKLDTILTA
jgi:GTP-binding nuclear protein Ran